MEVAQAAGLVVAVVAQEVKNIFWYLLKIIKEYLKGVTVNVHTSVRAMEGAGSVMAWHLDPASLIPLEETALEPQDSAKTAIGLSTADMCIVILIFTWNSLDQNKVKSVLMDLLHFVMLCWCTASAAPPFVIGEHSRMKMNFKHNEKL